MTRKELISDISKDFKKPFQSASYYEYIDGATVDLEIYKSLDDIRCTRLVIAGSKQDLDAINIDKTKVLAKIFDKINNIGNT